MLNLAIENIENWIFVTGLIRGGTTFTGKMLSLPLSVDYIHEPFHGGYTLPDREPLRPCYVRPGRQDDEVQAYQNRLAHLFHYDIGIHSANPYEKDSWLRKAIKAVVGSRGPVYLTLAKLNPFHTTALIKEPVGKLMAEHLHLTFGVKPVILIRHPASWAASLKRVGWWPGVREFAEQPHLVEDYLADEQELLHRDWKNPMLKSAAHWRLSFKVLLAQAEKYPSWQVVTHEKLSECPLDTFERLYRTLDLPWSASVEKKIRSYTRGNDSAEVRGGRVQDFQRNSAALFEMRRDSLSKDERRAIFEIVKDVALQIYSRESFAID